MAILSVDTYLQEQIKEKLHALLRNPYIIKEVILKDFNPKIREAFINTFCVNSEGDVKKEIPVTFTFPRTKQEQSAFVLIQFKGAQEPEEKDGSLGLLKGNSNASAGDVEKEKLEVTVYTDEDGKDVYYFQTAKPVYKLIGFDSMSVSSTGVQVDGNKVFVDSRYIHSDDYKTTLTYVAVAQDTDGEYKTNDKGKLVGLDLLEVYTIDYVSNNMDTLRCLDAILRTIFIMMRTNKDEQVELRLQSLQFRGTDLLATVNNDQNSAGGQQLYFRRIEAGYDDTYSIFTDSGFDINDFKLNKETRDEVK